jgi:hypothetical protein
MKSSFIYVGDAMRGDALISEFINKFEIIEARFFMDESIKKGEVILSFENNILNYTFQFFFSVYDIALIDLLMKKETKEIITFNQFYKYIYSLTPESDKSIFVNLNEKDLNKFIMYKIQDFLKNEMINKLKENFDIKFLDFNNEGNKINIHCQTLIFGEDIKFNLRKSSNLILRSNKMVLETESIENWFEKKLEIEMDYSYDREAMARYYHITNILGGIILEKFKETSRYKLLVLYNPNLKKMFEIN